MAFTVATYNVLATAYIKPEWYPFTPRELLDPARRLPALVEHVAQFGADVVCLQEVEGALYAALDRRLSALGYTGSLAKKGHNKPDGCATFFRSNAFEPVRVVRVEYRDADAGRPNSGHVAQILVLKEGPRSLGVANTHLKWDLAGVPRDQRFGLRQVRQLLRKRGRLGPECSGWVICGDLNVTPDSDVMDALRNAGFESSHAVYPWAATCNPNRRAKVIDYILHDGALRSEPLALPPVDDDTPLPGPGQPSDHVAVMARMDWRAGIGGPGQEQKAGGTPCIRGTPAPAMPSGSDGDV
jgi:endonuclease/exonuclease/phosphatase family metal-dependent hydrolase